MEEWKAVPRWEGLYEVSNLGRVRSVPHTVKFSDGRERHYPSVLRSFHLDSFGYQKLTLKQAGRQERVHVHRLVTAAWVGPRPKGLDVCHTDGDRTNNIAENLRYGTPADNRADSMRHGTSIRPTMRKVDDAAVAAIRAARGAISVSALAFVFGISKPHICSIQKGIRRA